MVELFLQFTEIKIKRKVRQYNLSNFSDLRIILVTLRDQNWNTLQASLEQLAGQLDDLKVLDDTLDKVP